MSYIKNIFKEFVKINKQISQMEKDALQRDKVVKVLQQLGIEMGKINKQND